MTTIAVTDYMYSKWSVLSNAYTDTAGMSLHCSYELMTGLPVLRLKRERERESVCVCEVRFVVCVIVCEREYAFCLVYTLHILDSYSCTRSCHFYSTTSFGVSLSLSHTHTHTHTHTLTHYNTTVTMLLYE